MTTVIALDIAMNKSYKVTFNGQECLSEGEVVHNQTGFQELLNEIHSLPKDIMLVFESTGIYSKQVETFCQKNQLRYCVLNPLEAKNN